MLQKNIKFGSKKFDAAICLKGDFSIDDIFRLGNQCSILAADGAAIKLIDNNITPDYVIGDLDSVDIVQLANLYSNEKVVCLADQETNDFEKVINFALTKNFRNVLIFGFHGGDLEHTLNNWSIVQKYHKKINMTIIDKGRYALPLDETITINVKIGEIISIIPQSTVLLKTRNLKWELNNELLELGVREGARNQAVDSQIEIEIISGSILLFVDEHLPFAPEY